MTASSCLNTRTVLFVTDRAILGPSLQQNKQYRVFFCTYFFPPGLNRDTSVVKIKFSPMCKVMKNVISVLVLVWSCLPCFANNVRLNGTVKVTSGVATLELDLAWDNSWRDNFNWDAVWIFLKYKAASGAWSHVMLQDITHTATNGYQVMNGKNDDGKVVGVYVFPGTNGTTKQVSTKVTLKWGCGAAYTKAMFDNNQVFILAQGIEMVCIPFGTYYLGDGASANTLGASDGMPLIINGEGIIAKLYQRASDGTVSVATTNLSADYPKGYHGFYIMKYETSQEQYVTFLNTLTKAQQETLLGASFLAALSPGRYIFGDTLRPSFRNGIILSTKPEGQPYIFDNNLNGNDVYGEDGDGQCIACNYMSLNDMLAYASWAGLRPMSELEYERACRAPFPQAPMTGEYPWNNNSGVSRVTGLSAGGKETEIASNTTCNVNSDNGLTGNNQGPVRCGLFARNASTQLSAGATYWGVMEMAGNVRELVAAVSHTSLNRTINGGGAFNTTVWTNTPTLFGLRGGSFSGVDSLLRTSNRNEMTEIISVAKRDSTVGFRLTRSLSAGIVTVDPGTISLSAPLCPDVESTVSETAAASVTGIPGNFPLTYIWSYSTDNGSTWTIIPGVTANTLKYSAFVAEKTYLFRRTAVCALGTASTQTSSISIPNMNLSVVPVGGKLELCKATKFTASNGSSYVWSFQGNNIRSQANYIPSYADFGNSSGEFTVTCTALIGGCNISKDVIIDVEPNTLVQTFVTCGDRLVDACGNSYATRLMADGRCWMIENLRTGTCNTSTFDSYANYNVKGLIAPNLYGVCAPSEEIGGGYLYNGAAALQDNVNTINPLWASTQWQGICPNGWHLPSVQEFTDLQAKIGTSKFYSCTPYGDDWCGVRGGQRQPGLSSGAGSWGRYWSRELNGDNMYFLDLWYSSVAISYAGFGYGFAIRCIKNY